MSRRKSAPKRDILPDPLFDSELITKFINIVMCDGKKAVTEKIVYGALNNVAKQADRVARFTRDDKYEVINDDDKTKNDSVVPLPMNTDDIHTNDAARRFALKSFKKALGNVMPTVEVRSRRVGGSTYQVPVEVRSVRRMALAMRWLCDFANKRSEKTMILRLANEILEAIEGRGGAVKKREDVHRMAKANQAFAHYKW